MPEPAQWYRVYVVGSDGHIVSRFDVECADDAEAKTCAELLAQRRCVELWQGARKVATIAELSPPLQSTQAS